MEIVCDTNILISAIVFGGNAKRIVQLASEGSLINFISPAIVNEIENVLIRPKFGFSAEQVAEITQLFYESFEYIIPTTVLDCISTDPDDDRILELAFDAHVDYIISGDKHLLSLNSWEAIPIIKSAQFLQLL
jgi:uncharacterized protein